MAAISARWAAGAAAALLLAACTSPEATGPADPADTGEAPPAAEAGSPASAYAPSWSAVHADAANTDYAPVEPPDDLALAWFRDLEGSASIGPLEWTINLGPTIDPEGRVYVTSTQAGCHLQAIDGATGETLWCNPDLDQLAVVSSPLIDRDGHLYIADGQGMHALDRDGTERWRAPLDGVPLSAQFTPDGHVVFVTHAGTVYVLDRATGAHVVEPLDLVDGPPWDGGGLFACARGTEACPSANTIAVDEATGRLFFTLWAPGAPQAGLRAIAYTSEPEPALTELWTVDTLPGGSGSTPVVSADGDRVYVTDNAGSIHAIDAATGETAWTFPIGYAAGGSLSLSPEGLLMPAGGNGAALMAVQDAGDEGVLAWRRDDLQNRGIATQSAGGKVFATVHVGDQRNELVVLDTADGTVLDREPIPGTSVFSVGTTIGPDGTVYVPTITGGLAAYRAPSFERGPDPTEEALLGDGPFATASFAVPDGVPGFGGGVVHHPVVEDGTTFGAVALAPGFLGSSDNYPWWGPRLASHGFVVLLLDTEDRKDLPASRGAQLLAALDWLTTSSPVAAMVDGQRQAVVGHSLGGSGVLFAAIERPTLRAAVSLQPYHPRKDWPDVRVPILVVGSEHDAIAPPDEHAAAIYEGLTGAPEKAYVELAGASHRVSTAGDDRQGLFVLAWLKRFVDGDLRHEPFLCPGDEPGGPISDRRDTCPIGGTDREPAAAGASTGG